MEIDAGDLIRSHLGDRVRFFRRLKGFTQSQLGQTIGAGTEQSAKVTVAKIEGGQMPGGVRLKRLAEGLGCSADMLLTGQSRDFGELVRYYVQPRVAMNEAAATVFRAGRIFLFCALVQPGRREEFLDAANRLFFLAEHRPQICRKLLKAGSSRMLGTQQPSEGDIEKLLRRAMDLEEGDSDPVAESAYRLAYEIDDVIRTRYIAPDTLIDAPDDQVAVAAQAVSEAGAADLPLLGCSISEGSPQVLGSREIPAGSALLRVDNDSLHPFAARGQTLILAPVEQAPQRGELVAVWLTGGTVCYRRYLDDTEEGLLPVQHMSAGSETIDAASICSIRAIAGVLFGEM